MWEKASALVGVVILVAAIVATYYGLESRVSSLEDADSVKLQAAIENIESAELVEWKKSIEKYQSSGETQCTDIEVGFDMSHGLQQNEWCPANYFITKIDLDAHNVDTHGPVDNTRNNQWTFPIIGRVTCCRALPAPFN